MAACGKDRLAHNVGNGTKSVVYAVLHIGGEVLKLSEGRNVLLNV